PKLAFRRRSPCPELAGYQCAFDYNSSKTLHFSLRALRALRETRFYLTQSSQSSQRMKPIKFKSVLIKPDDHSGWHFIGVEGKIGEKFEKKDGSRRVVCTINGAETFQCALLPSSDGDFVIVVNKTKRTRLNISAGDKVNVELKVDDSKYGLAMPAEIKEVLNQEPDGDKIFHSLTPGKQRSLLYFVGKVKDIDNRIHTALILIEHLKKNDGKIVYELIQAELKRPSF